MIAAIINVFLAVFAVAVLITFAVLIVTFLYIVIPVVVGIFIIFAAIVAFYYLFKSLREKSPETYEHKDKNDLT